MTYKILIAELHESESYTFDTLPGMTKDEAEKAALEGRIKRLEQLLDRAMMIIERRLCENKNAHTVD